MNDQQPYVPTFCEELANARRHPEQLRHWHHRRVRILGKVRSRDLGSSLVTLQSWGEKQTTEISVSYRLETSSTRRILHPRMILITFDDY